MITINCTHCGKAVEISEALKHQFEEQSLADITKKHQEEMELAKKQVLEDSQKKITEQFDQQMKRLEEDSRSEKERNKQLLEQITELTKELRNTKREKDEAKLEMQKQLAEEEGKIREDASKKAQEGIHLQMMAKDKQLQDMLKELEDAKRKLQQGSQQTQGEVFELEFESLLAAQYPHDKILPVGKGIKGGDIIQEVWDSRGNFVGKILWELKNTKLWSEGWVDKLKTDKRTVNADDAVLISEIMPNDMKTAGFRDGVWVTQRPFVLPLGDTIRAKLIQLFYVKNSVQAKDEKMEILYTYLSGNEFKHRVEAIIEAFTGMQQEIEKEKRYFSNKWARDEKYIRLVIDNTIGMHGDLKGIIGSVLPQIKGLDTDLPVLATGQESLLE